MAGGAEFHRAAAELLDVDAAIRRALQPAASAGAQPIASETRHRAPRLTGKLESTVDHKPVEHGPNYAVHAVVVGTYYPFFQEYGTSKMPAHPFLRPAADTQRDEAVSRMRFVILTAITKVIG